MLCTPVLSEKSLVARHGTQTQARARRALPFQPDGFSLGLPLTAFRDPDNFRETTLTTIILQWNESMKSKPSLWITCILGGLVFLLTACGGPGAIRVDEDVERLREVTFAPDGSAFLLGDSRNQFVQLRAFPAGKVLWRLDGPGEPGWGPMAMAFSRDGTEVALAYGQRLRFYAAADGSLTGEISLGDDVLYVPFLAYRADGTLVAVVGRRGEEPMAMSVEVWSREGERVADSLHLPPFYTTTMSWWRPFTPDGNHLVYERNSHILGVVDVAQGTFQEWDLTEPLHFDEYPNELSIFSLSISPDGREVALGLSARPNNTLTDPSLVLRVSTETGQVVTAPPAPRGLRGSGWTGWSLSYRPGGDSLAVELYNLSSSALTLYSAEDASPLVLCKDEDCCARHPVFSPDGGTLATVCGRQVKLWDVEP